MWMYFYNHIINNLFFSFVAFYNLSKFPCNCRSAPWGTIPLAGNHCFEIQCLQLEILRIPENEMGSGGLFFMLWNFFLHWKTDR